MRFVNVIRQLRGEKTLRVVLEGDRYVETVGCCDHCGETTHEGHEVIDGRRFCCWCWHEPAT